MSEIVLSLYSNSIDKAIEEYHNTSFSGSTSDSNSSSSSSNSSSGGNTTDEEYTFGVLGILLEVFQEQYRTRAASRSGAGTSSAPLSTPLDEVETVYSCAVGIHSKTDEKRLASFRSWYQIPDDLNPRLAVRGEWCCKSRFGVSVYEAYLLGGLRLPLNFFARKLLTRLGLGICQFNPNA